MRIDHSLLLGCFALGVAAGAVAPFLLRELELAAPVSEPAREAVLLLHEQFIRALHTGNPDLNDPLAVFAFVFARLPERVQVYPTENYYYFTFWSEGQEVRGNLRLDAADREAGVLSFGYFGAHSNPERREDTEYLSHFRQLGAADGVAVSKESALQYAVTFNGKRVVFNLYDLPQTLPDGLTLQPYERFIARTFDESGFQFILIYDTELPSFRFILDETAPAPDVLTEVASGVFSGRLSGFAFYEDSQRRKILFGVNTNNIRTNNYFDGPFDQLADNFVSDNTLREAMETAYPHTRGRIDERGIFVDESGNRLNRRLAITPYLTYTSVVELQQAAERCEQTGGEVAAIRCLTRDYKQGAHE